MKGQERPLPDLIRRLEGRWRTVRGLHRFLRAEFYALLVSLGFFVPARLLGTPGQITLSLLLPTTVVAFLLLVDTIRSRRSPLQLLWDADNAHGGHHTLPAAFGTLSIPEERREQAGIGEAVRRRAEELMPRVREENTYPWRIPLEAYFIPVAILGILLLSLFLESVDRGAPPNPWLGYAQELQERAEEMARAAERVQDREGAALAKELAALAEMLETRPTEKETQERIARLIPQLQDGMRRLGATDLITDPASPQSGVAEEAEQSGTLRAGREQSEGVPVLPDDLGGTGDAPRSESGRGEPLGEISKDLEAASEALEQLQESLSGANQTGEAPPQQAESDERAAGNTPGRGSGNAGEAEEEADESEPGGAGFDAGDEAVADLAEEESDRVAGAVQRLLELPRSEREPESFTELFAREAPGTPHSALSPEETLPAFRRQVEEAVASSPIPPELRELVRDYFLRIGEEQYE